MIRGPVRLYQKLERMIQKGRHGSALNSLMKLAFSASILGGRRNARTFQAKRGDRAVVLSYITRVIRAC